MAEIGSCPPSTPYLVDKPIIKEAAADSGEDEDENLFIIYHQRWHKVFTSPF